MRPFTAEAKLKLIKCALKGEKVTKICQQAGVSRKTFYSWLKKYKSSKINIVHFTLADKRFKKIFSFRTLHPKEKLLIINKALAKEASVLEICANYQISRKTFYKWLKRYQERGENGLYDLRPKGTDHYRTTSKGTEEVVLQYVAQNPDLSVHRLARELNFIGHHGIQNLLLRQDLNTIAKRQLFAQGYITRPEIMPVPGYETLARPLLARWRWLFAPFVTIPKFVIRTPAIWPLVIPLFILTLYIFEFDKLLRPSMFFPAVALFFGLMFFLYSLKYYVSLIFVMAFQGQTLPSSENRQSQDAGESRFGKFFAKLLGSNTTRTTAIAQNLDKVTLSRYPFVSVHLPLYNEKRVVERLLNAVTSLDWPPSPSPSATSSGPSGSGQANFEVIVIDDSTDETTSIIKALINADDRELICADRNEELEIYISRPKRVGPVIKLIHRSSRAGFKGAALQRALENTDPRAEYICVFDADFVPFPDTIEQFVKTFQVLGEGNRQQAIGNRDQALGNRELGTSEKNLVPNAQSLVPNALRIAAVQGYQWHVLNKSENWITRGVRTEYAGSYVVERAGVELYGGLKMIAGSVFAIRVDVLKRFGWGTSITEDLELTLKLYEAGYKVAFTPYIQAPAEAVSTVKRLIRQRMRWAEGHTFNIKRLASSLLASSNMTGREKFEFLYLGPYYLQAAFFIVGTLAWFIAETVVHAQLPFWTAAWGWSLVFVNFLSLPMMNLVGLFLEESDERDYLGIASFVLLSYLLVPFQAYAATKALFEKEEGPWFRTPKTGRITDVIGKSTFYRWLEKIKIWPRPEGIQAMGNRPVGNRQWALGNSLVSSAYCLVPSASSFNPLSGYKIRPKRLPLVARGTIAGLLIIVIFFNFLAFLPPVKNAEAVGTPKIEQQINIIDQEYSTSSSTAVPTDSSLGLIRWDSSTFSDLSNANSYVKFEAVMYSALIVSNYSAVFNSSNYPVTAYKDPSGKLRVVRCGDVNCAGADEAIYQVNSESVSYAVLDIKLDASNYPVIAYADGSNNLKVAHCIAVQCSGTSYVNQVNSETVYSGGRVGLALDGSGNPVIAYADSSLNLKVAHCNDANCAGSNETVNQVNAETAMNANTTLKLDSSGYPVIAYNSNTGTQYLKVAHCNDPNCAGTNESASPVNTETPYPVLSFVLDSSGYPVIAYRDYITADALKVAHCINANCSGTSNVNRVNSESTTSIPTVALDSSGYPVIAYGYINLKVAHCNEANCTGGNEVVNTVNSETGYPAAHRLDSLGYPVIICTTSLAALEVAYCNDVNCASSNETINGVLGSGGTVALHSSSGTLVSTSAVTSTSSTYTRVRSNNIKSDGNFTTDTDFSVRAYIANGQTVYVKAARLIIYQEGTDNASITKTQTQVEVGNFVTEFSYSSYTSLTNYKVYCYDVTQTAQTCTTGASPSRFNPTPTIYFEATLKVSGSATVYAALFTSGGTKVSGSDVFTSSTSYTRVRSSSITLSPGTAYWVYVMREGGGATANIANAKIILDQSADGGVSALETVQMYANTNVSTTTTYASYNFPNQFTSTSFSGSLTYYYEADLYVSDGKSPSGNNNSRMHSSTQDLGAVTTTSTSVLKLRSTSISPNTGEFDTQLECNTCSARIAYMNKSWLIIQMQSIPVPEIAIFALPGMLFLPRIVKWVKERRARRKKKTAGNRLPRKLAPAVIKALGIRQ